MSVLPMPYWLCFDLDGTLVDSSPDITLSINLMLAELGYEQVSQALVQQWIGNGAEKLLERALEHALDAEPNAEITHKARQLFIQAYAANAANLTTCYPGCLEVLRYFHQADVRMACVTNKPRQFVLPLFDALELHPYFSALVCGDDLATKKPSPEPILFAVRELGGNLDNGFMVGDSETDMLAAKQAGAGAIYVSYGYNRGVSVDKYQPVMIDNLTELMTIFPT